MIETLTQPLFLYLFFPVHHLPHRPSTEQDFDVHAHGLDISVPKARKGVPVIITTVLSSAQQTSIALDISNNDRNTQDVLEKLTSNRSPLNITKPMLLRWVRTLGKLQLDQGEDANLPGQGKVGRPGTLDDQASEELDKVVLAGNLSSDSIKFDDDFEHGLLLKLIKDTQERAGKPTFGGLPVPKTIEALLDQAGVRVVKGRVVSHARYLALHDPRAPICSTIANELYVKNKLANLILNFDDTTYVVRANGVCRVLLSSNAPPDLDTRFLDDSELPMGIKVRVTITAIGHASPSVYVIANENVPAGTIIAVKVMGLSHSTDPSAFGYIVFASTRGGNVAMNKWYYETILCPEVVKIRAGCTFPAGATEFDKSATVFMDGEDSQLKAMMLPEVLELFRTHNMDSMKSNASLSLAEQACDVGNLFRGGKLKIKELTTSQAHNESLSLAIAAALTSPDLAVLALAAGKCQKLVLALLKVAHVQQEVTTVEAIKKSFQMVGQAGPRETWESELRSRAFGLNKKGSTTSLWKFTSLEWKHILEHWDEMKDFFLKNGQLTDEFMDSLNMPRYDGKPGNHEDKVLSHQRTTVLTQLESIQRYNDYHLRKKEVADAAAARKVVDAAKKGAKAVGGPVLEECRKFFEAANEVKSTMDELVGEVKAMVGEVRGSVDGGIRGALSEFKLFEKEAKDVHEEGRKIVAGMREKKARAEDFFKASNVGELKVKHGLLSGHSKDLDAVKSRLTATRDTASGRLAALRLASNGASGSGGGGGGGIGDGGGMDDVVGEGGGGGEGANDGGSGGGIGGGEDGIGGGGGEGASDGGSGEGEASEGGQGRSGKGRKRKARTQS